MINKNIKIEKEKTQKISSYLFYFINSKNITKIIHSRYLTEEEIAALVIPEDPEAEEPDDENEETVDETGNDLQPENPQEQKIPIPPETIVKGFQIRTHKAETTAL